MAGRHWLDPLARRLLVATGQLPPLPPAAPTDLAGEADEAVERELLALKLAQNPGLRLRDAAEVRQAAALGWTLEVNVAAAADWLRLPGCRPDLVDRLIAMQRDGIQWRGPGELAAALQVPPELVLIWLPVLRFARQGEPASARAPVPLAINQASEGLLREWPVVASGVAKHHGYAFQWFGLSGLIALLYVWFQIVQPRRQKRLA
jgi:cytochrome oxidase assembly protein ShyY1